jgi:hypothetical protein
LLGLLQSESGSGHLKSILLASCWSAASDGSFSVGKESVFIFLCSPAALTVPAQYFSSPLQSHLYHCHYHHHHHHSDNHQPSFKLPSPVNDSPSKPEKYVHHYQQHGHRHTHADDQQRLHRQQVKTHPQKLAREKFARTASGVALTSDSKSQWSHNNKNAFTCIRNTRWIRQSHLALRCCLCSCSFSSRIVHF